MNGFCADLPLEVIRDILCKYYGLDLDSNYIVWYNEQSNTLVLEPAEFADSAESSKGKNETPNEFRDETDAIKASPDCANGNRK